MVAKMTSEAETRINLTALKRRDPYISNILDSATQVAVYTFNHTSGEWEKTEVEGTLFVYSRRAPPTAGFTIMNRLSMENLTEPLTGDLEFQNQSPFLLYRNAKLMIYGIWFYDMYDCLRIGKLLADLCKHNKKPSAGSCPPLPANSNHSLPSPNSTGSSSASSMSEAAIDEELAMNPIADESRLSAVISNGTKQPVDIMNILCKAKDDYDKTHSKTNKQGTGKQNGALAELFKPVPVKSDGSKKFNVASLFGQSEIKKTEQSPRPSSADVFGGPETNCSNNSTNQPPKSQRRYASRSLSLSLTSEQFLIQQPNIVNGAISVEELESPVLGMPAQRARYYSTSESSSRNAHSPHLPTMEDSSAFNKLLGGKISSTSKFDNHGLAVSNAAQTLATKTNSMTNAMSQPNWQPKALHRSQSIPSGVVGLNLSCGNSALSSSLPKTSSGIHNHNAQSSTALSFASSLPPLTMPTLHENIAPSNGLIKSMSVASGLARMPYTTTAPSVQIAAALHGTSKKDREQVMLLSPHALQPTKPSNPAHTSTLPNAYSNLTTISANPTVPISITSAMKSNVSASDCIMKTLISPEDFEHSTATPQKAMELRQRLLPSDAVINNLQPLDKNQLSRALVTLLQNDRSFLETVHKAYISGFETTQQSSKPNASSVPIPPLWK